MYIEQSGNVGTDGGRRIPKIRLIKFGIFESDSDTDLGSYLIRYGIPVDQWGKGYAKTIEHLEKEIESNECSLVDKNGTLVREVEFVMCEIFYKGLKLKEEKQCDMPHNIYS